MCIKTGDCPGSVADFFFFVCKKKLQSAHFLTVSCEIGNIAFFFVGLNQHAIKALKECLWRNKKSKMCFCKRSLNPL